LAKGDTPILLFFGFPQLETLPRAQALALPMHVWGNGNTRSLDETKLCSVLASVQDLVFPWKDANGAMKPSIHYMDSNASVHEVFTKRHKQQTVSLQNRATKLVFRHATRV
jgi:hypothetical protein